MTPHATTASDALTSATEPEKLKRMITGPLLYLFILGEVLGAGIYALMGVLSQKVGGVLWAPLLIALLLACARRARTRNW